MGRYFLLQCKRIGRFLPGALLATVILMGGLLAMFTAIVQWNDQQPENQKISVALVGYTDDALLQSGISLFRSIDPSRYSLEVGIMDEQQARRALNAGKITAYIVIPEGFVEDAVQGNVRQLEFVGTVGSAGLMSIFKEEISSVISCLLLASERGVFAMSNALEENGLSVGQHMNKMTLRYSELILGRDKTYTVCQVGVGDQLGLMQYLLCGFAVTLLTLCCLSFAPVMISTDVSINRMLASDGRPIWLQCLCDLGAYLLALTLLTGILAVPVAHFAALSPVNVILRLLPVLLMIGSLSFLLYTLASDLVGGIALQFFVSLALCFLSGCLYPVYFFPVKVQELSAWLPMGVARMQIAGCLTGSTASTPILCLYSLVLIALSTWIRVRKVQGVQR